MILLTIEGSVGALNFGMIDKDANNENPGRKDKETWVIVFGCLTMGNALLNCFILCTHPHFQKAAPDAKANPSELTEAEVMAYVRAHPEVAQKAAGEATFSGAAAPEEDAFFGAPASAQAPQQPPRRESKAPAAYSPPAYTPPADVAAKSNNQPAAKEANPFESDNPFAS